MTHKQELSRETDGEATKYLWSGLSLADSEYTVN